MIVQLALKLQSRTSPNSAWHDSDWGPLDHDLASQILWMAQHGYDHWMEHRLVIA